MDEEDRHAVAALPHQGVQLHAIGGGQAADGGAHRIRGYEEWGRNRDVSAQAGDESAMAGVFMAIARR